MKTLYKIPLVPLNSYATLLIFPTQEELNALQKRKVSGAAYWYLDHADAPADVVLPESEGSRQKILAIAKKIKDRHWQVVDTVTHKPLTQTISGRTIDYFTSEREANHVRDKFNRIAKSRQMADGGDISDMPEDSIEYLIDQSLKPLIREVRNQVYVPEARDNASDYEVLGIIVSKFCRWDFENIREVCSEAMEDSNFRPEARLVEEMAGKSGLYQYFFKLLSCSIGNHIRGSCDIYRIQPECFIVRQKLR